MYSLSLSHRWLPGHFTEEKDLGLNLEGAAEDRGQGNVRVAQSTLAWLSWTGPGGSGRPSDPSSVLEPNCLGLETVGHG